MKCRDLDAVFFGILELGVSFGFAPLDFGILLAKKNYYPNYFVVYLLEGFKKGVD